MHALPRNLIFQRHQRYLYPCGIPSPASWLAASVIAQDTLPCSQSLGAVPRTWLGENGQLPLIHKAEKYLGVELSFLESCIVFICKGREVFAKVCRVGVFARKSWYGKP